MQQGCFLTTSYMNMTENRLSQEGERCCWCGDLPIKGRECRERGSLESRSGIMCRGSCEFLNSSEAWSRLLRKKVDAVLRLAVITGRTARELLGITPSWLNR